MTSEQDEMISAFTLKRHEDGIAVIEMDVAGEAQNTLKAGFAEQFAAVLDEARGQRGLKGLVIRSVKPGSFMAGADIAMLGRMNGAVEVEALSRSGQAVFQKIADFPVPVVAVIDGACLGGGLELALACHGRVCADSRATVLGLPEVMLGLLPALGGTQRLPRLIGIARSLDLLLTGRHLKPAQAEKLGLVDEVVSAGVLVEAAVKRIESLGAAPRRTGGPQGRPVRAGRGLSAARSKALNLALEANPIGRKLLFQQARKKIRARTLGNYPAAERILDVVELGFAKGLKTGYAAEARAFGELANTDVSRQCRNIFFAQKALRKESFVADKNAKPRTITRVGVLGAGLMGSGIALVSANQAKLDVRLKDRDAKGLAYGHAYLRKFYGQRIQRRAMSQAEAGAELSRVTGTTDYGGFGQLDLVVEAVFEDLKLKHQMLKEVEAQCRPDTIFASNTSSIPIADIAKAAQRPENVIGLHYFSPVEKMPLLEIIATPQTAPEVVAASAAFGKAQGKTVIVVRDGPGFYTTRILAPYLNEATRLAMEGVNVRDIDRALMRAGYPIGAITLLDEVGIDVCLKVGPMLRTEFGERMASPAGADKIIESGSFGRKTGKGFYLHDGAGKGRKPINLELYKMLGVTPHRKMEDREIAGRCLWLMVNEAAWCLQDGILSEPMHGDIGAIFGLGFPPFLGGPFRHLDSIGAAAAVARMEQLAAAHGPRFTPAPMLCDMAKSKQKFYS